MKVFLGGTCNESDWRSIAEQYLHFVGIGTFNPVVKDWNAEAQANEMRERKECDYCWYVLTPKMSGYYSIAEVVEDSIMQTDKTMFIILDKDGNDTFTKEQRYSLTAVAQMVQRNGSPVFYEMLSAVNYILEAQIEARKLKGGLKCKAE